jgi:hypothetical protein
MINKEGSGWKRSWPKLPHYLGTCLKVLTKTTKQLRIVESEVLTAVSVKMAVFWVVAPCGLV